MARPKPPRRRPGAILIATLAWALVALIVALALARERAQALDRSAQSSKALAMVLKEATARTFQSVDLVLSGLADNIALHQPSAHDEGFRSLMRSQLKQLPYVRALYVIGPDGFILQDTDYPATPHVSLADRSYFARYVQQPSLQRDVSEPLQSRSGHGWFNAVTRRLQRGNQFAGVIVAAMRPQYMAAQFQQIALGEGQSMALHYRDGRLIASFPPRERDIGQQEVGPTTFERAQRPGLLVERLAAEADRSHALVRTFMPVDALPLMVSVSHDESVALAGWRRAAWMAGLGLLFLAALASTLVWFDLQRRQEAERRQERRIQAEKLEAVGLLTGVVAHDTANLLGILANNTEIIRRLTAGNAAVERALDVTQRTVNLGRRMLSQLTSVVFQAPQAAAPIAIDAAIEKSLPMLRQAVGTDIELRLVHDGEPLPSAVDETQLCVALVNLLVNARDAMQGQGTVTVSIFRCSAADIARQGLPSASAYACVTVTDNGPGMTPEVRRRALDPFFTTKGPRGTGLGLAQVHAFVKRAHGELVITSEPQRGTRIGMYFPLAAVEAAPEATLEPEPSTAELTAARNA